MEELGDAGYHIFVRLNDKATAALLLTSPAMAAMYDKLDANPLFWKGKVEQALIEEEEAPEPMYVSYQPPRGRQPQDRLDVDWKFVYRNVKDGGTVILNDAPIASANTLRVLIEDLGMRIWMRRHSDVWLANAGVLNYLISNAEKMGVPEHSVGGIMKHIVEDNPASVAEAALIDVLKNPDAAEIMKIASVSALIEEGVTDNLIEITEKYAPGILGSQYMLTTAAINMAVLQGPWLPFILSVREFSTAELVEAMTYALKYDMSVNLLNYVQEHLSFDVISSLLLNYSDERALKWLASAQFSPSEWRSILERAVRTDRQKIVLLCLEHISPNNQDLVDALKHGSYQVVTVLLSSEKINPNMDVRSLLLAAKDDRGVRVLVRHPRLNIDSLDRESLELVAEAFNLKYVSNYPSYKFYEPDTAYWFIARYLFLKEPGPVQLLGYIRDALLYTDEVKQAITSVLDYRADYSDEAAPIRALFLFLVYPNMTVSESEEYLRDDDQYSDELVQSSNFLIRMVKRSK